ncbi:PREDICTED: mitochondrial inner membrane protein OXA1-like [Camelina sativa]|uniref:Mitochondrial inner membrane protein OXA1-like n=1 Tax=Camelina sativa TaxID=90675 RepID=A0ABM0XDS1_CAMSA|nr:PREDICTED: mitochondrial inner membrane protein OXA1-like [Camelina sativa]
MHFNLYFVAFILCSLFLLPYAATIGSLFYDHMQLMKPRLESIREEMQNKGMDSVTMAEGQKEMKNLFKEYGVTLFTPMKGMLIQRPLFICFFSCCTFIPNRRGIVVYQSKYSRQARQLIHSQKQTLPPSPVNPRATSLSPVSKRLKALESQVKGRKKNNSKKR